YFVWYYLEHGKSFRPEDIYAGNVTSAWESLEAGVTTTVDWSHGLQTVDHAEAAVDALRSVPGRFVMAYGNIQAGPWEWTADPAVRSFLERLGDDMMGEQMAFDVTGDPAFPEKAAFEVARELGIPVTTHAAGWGAPHDPALPPHGPLRGGPRARHPGDDPRRCLRGHERHRQPADVRRPVHDAGDDV